MAYKLNWNEETKRVETIGWDPRTDKEPVSNLVGANDSVMYTAIDYGGAAPVMRDAINHRIERGDFKMAKCRECGMWFVLKKKDCEWFNKNEIPVPKRCKCCREARKRTAYREELANAINEAKGENKDEKSSD